MISELLMTYVFDRLDKQIILRIPYALLISLIAHIIFDLKPLLLPLSIISFIMFIVSTALFNMIINNALENILVNIDFKRLIEKLAKIFEGKTSLLDDIKAQENLKIITLGILSGTFFILLLSTAFLMILDYFTVKRELAIPMIIILLIYIYQDIAEADLLKEYQTKETETPFLQDIAETYMVDNSLKSFPIKSPTKVAIKFASRIIGPLCHMATPKIYSDALIVYKNQEIVSLIKQLAKANGKIYLKHEQGQSIENFFTSNRHERITVLTEKSPKENFPYLFNPNYSYSEKDKKKWIALSLRQKINDREKVLGYLFMHLFKGVLQKRKIKGKKRAHFEEEVKSAEVLLLIFIGERSHMEYLKTKIEIISTKYPTNLLYMETEY